MNTAGKKKEVSGSEQHFLPACCNTSATHNINNNKIFELIHMLKFKKNGESLGIRGFKIIGGRTVAYGARINQLR